MKVKSEREVAQSCPTLSDPMDCSLPGSSLHGIFQARALEWGAIAFSRILASMAKKKRKKEARVLPEIRVIGSKESQGECHGHLRVPTAFVFLLVVVVIVQSLSHV